MINLLDKSHHMYLVWNIDKYGFLHVYSARIT